MATNPDILHELGSRVRDLRLAKNLSQEAFADMCNLDRTYISGIERGKWNAWLLKLKLIAGGLDIELAKLLQGL